jgi:hypothetical protein
MKPPTTPSGTGTTSPSSTASTGVQSLADDAQQKVGQTVDQVREAGKSRLGNQKDRMAGSVDSFARALRETSRQLKQGDDTPIAEYVEGAAERVEQLSSHLRQRSVDELIYDAESFARRQPALFLGGAFFLGAMAARFLKSSRPASVAMANGPSSRGSMPYGGSSPTRYSWQDASMGSRPSQLPAPARPPIDSPRYPSGSAYPSPGPRSS